MRSLSPEEAELWSKVAATIRPLSREPRPSQDGPGEAVKPVEDAPRPIPRAPRVRPPRSGDELKPKPAPGSTLDGSWDRRLERGSVEPDRVLDLHGHNLDSAWSAIDRAIERALQSNERVLLLITGHARQGEPPVERGKIRAAVHDWLAVSRHARDIAAVRGAHRRHGGGGSLYIILRRARS